MSTSNVAAPSSPLARAIERIMTKRHALSQELARRAQLLDAPPRRKRRTWRAAKREILGHLA